MQDLSGISVVLPSLDPDEKLTAVIDGLLEYGFSDIILVNDGSKPENLHYFEEAAAAHPEIHLLHHEVNKGKGAALKTAFSWFLKNRPGAVGVVTVDGDNQHHPEDTRNCALQMRSSGKLVLGVRDFSLPHVPERSRKGNKITCTVFKIFCGMTISDTQTGLRAIPTSALKTLVGIKGDRFEYETNMLLALKEHHIHFEEVKIRTVYIEENKSSHFRAVRDSWRIYKLILGHFFKYTLSSVVSSVFELIVVALLNMALLHVINGFWFDTVPGFIGRAISSLLNFYINKRLVFHSHGNTGKALGRYYMLALPQMVLQVMLSRGAYLLFDIPDDQTALRMLIYMAVMCILFVASYTIQQRWVFAGKTPKKEDSDHV